MFFSHHLEKGVDWYRSFFSRRPPGAITGEVCPTYLDDPSCPGRIHEVLPQVKIVAILRQPSQQILSHYRLRRLRGLTTRELSEDLRADDTYLFSVRYYEHLTPYIERFSRKNVLVLFYEELQNSPESFLTKLYDFLGVRHYFPDDLDSPVNASRTVRFRALEISISASARFLRKRGLIKLKQALGRTRIHEILRRLNRGVITRPDSISLTESDLALIDAATDQDRKLLGELLNRDLSGWA